MDLSKIREEINNADSKIFDALVQRKEAVLRVAEYKKENNLPIRDIEREKEILSLKKKKAQNLGLSEELIEKIFRLMIEDAVEAQEEMREV